MAFWRKRDEDLNDEIASHLRMAAADVGEDEARRQFGNQGLVKEVTREMWGFRLLEIVMQDLRYALRVLGKNPGYALIAVLSLALGIGANTAIFSLIDSIMLEKLPVHNAAELVSIGDPAAISYVEGGTVGDLTIFSYPFYKRFQERNGVFSDVYATGRSEPITLEDSAEHPLARFITNNYFSVLGVTPLLGSGFIPAGQPVVIISYAFWERHFQRAPDVIGRKLRLNGTLFTITGVTPREFFGDVVGYQSDLWIPMEEQPLANPGHNYLNDPKTQWLQLMGRLKSGVSLAQATTVTNRLGLAIVRELNPTATPDDLKTLAARTIAVQAAASGFSRIRHTFSKPLLMLMGLVALVLLICCTNVANLQLARATSRSREIGLRLAIGASRIRLLSQLMTESLALAIAGGIVALLVAMAMTHLLLVLVARNNRLPLDVHLSGTTLLFTIALSLATSLFFGLAPALFATKDSVASNLKESKSGRSHSGAQRFEKSLVIFQIVLSSILLFGSGLFIRSLQKLENSDVGYRREHLIIAELDPALAGYDGKRLIELGSRVLETVRNAPGIRSASISENGLFSGTESFSGVTVPGFVPRSEEDKVVHADRVSGNYFEVIGTPILSGRGIEARDMGNAPRVAVLNEAMAHFYFPNSDPVGHRISVDEGKSWITIVGVVRNSKQNSLRDQAARRLYSQFAFYKDDPIGSIKLEVRTQTSTAQAEDIIRKRLRSVDANLQIETISDAQSLIDEELVQERLIAKLSSSFSLVSLLLASIGLYGVMSYLTQRRTTELGIRMALGASRGEVMSMILKETLLVTSIGLAIGIVAAVFLGRLVSGSLYEVASYDPLTALIASLCIISAAFLAGGIPARRASRIDPMAALRAE